MSKKSRLIGVLLLVGVAMGWTAVRAAEPAAEDAVVKMEEVSAFDAKEVGPYGQISSRRTDRKLLPRPIRRSRPTRN